MAKVLKGYLHEYIWGGKKLAAEFGKDPISDRVGESWDLSFVKDKPCTIDGIPIFNCVSKEDLGKNCVGFEFFPCLIKLIDANDDLSIQVHPTDKYALKNENQFGKTEMWYILSSDEGSGVWFGCKEDIAKKDLRELVESGKIVDKLNFFPCKTGDVFFVNSGTIHAIGKGITLYEVQQNSTLTYRLYDFKRKDKDGKERELHVDKGMLVSDLSKFELPINKYNSIDEKNYTKKYLGGCKYFTSFSIKFDGKIDLGTSKNTFNCLTLVEGEAIVNGLKANKGESIIIYANENINIEGKGTIVMSKVSKYNIGIDLGGTYIKGGVVTDDGELIYDTQIPTEVDKGLEIVEDNIVKLINSLCKECNLSLDDITNIGAGIPGLIDSEHGYIEFSNNLFWHKVHLVDDIEKKLGRRIKIGNDANVATLGEAIFGGGNGRKNVAMLTLGTGLGSGFIINGKVFEGDKGAGTEFGHTLYKKNGRQCTCGSKGCFETYVSATALIKDTKEALEKHKDSLMWNDVKSLDDVGARLCFEYKDKDKYAKEVVDNFIESLGDALVNIGNIFRPEVILIGGGVSKQGDNLIIPLQKYLDENVYAGINYQRIEVKVATLGNRAGILGASIL